MMIVSAKKNHDRSFLMIIEHVIIPLIKATIFCTSFKFGIQKGNIYHIVKIHLSIWIAQKLYYFPFAIL
jgi:hypothetical protein